MNQTVFIVTSLVLHAGFMLSLAADSPSSISGTTAASPVHVRIIGEPSPRKSAPAPKPKPAPQEKAKVAVKEPVVKKDPEPLAEAQLEHAAVSPSTELESQAQETAQDASPSDHAAGAVGSGAGVGEAPSENLSRTAVLDERSFVKPRHTLLARKAGYKTDFIAEVFVTREGRAKEVRFDREILYGMDERIIQAIKRATFKPATNRLGMTVDSWVGLRFHLDIE